MHANQMTHCADAMDEVANVLEQLSLKYPQVFDELKVRSPLADELGGFAGMLREHAKSVEQVDAQSASVTHRGTPNSMLRIDGMAAEWISEMTRHYLEHLVVLASNHPDAELFSGGPFVVADLHVTVCDKAAGICRKFAAGYIAAYIREGNLTPEQCGRGLARTRCGLPGFSDLDIPSAIAADLERSCKPFGIASLIRADEECVRRYGMTLGVVYDI